jgi:hypothetical protein
MSRKIGEYDHLNEDSRLELSVDMDELAKKIEKMNYGTHRFLSALVRARRKSDKCHSLDRDELADGIEALLNKGLF